MAKLNIAMALLLVQIAAAMIIFGAALFTAVVIYPNWFHDIPRSLEIGREFFVAKNFGGYSRPLVTLFALAGFGVLLFGWRAKSARYWILSSILFGTAVEMAVFKYCEPRLEIISQSTALHSAAYLKQIAQEFQTAHLLQLGAMFVVAALSWTGLLKIHRYKVSPTAGKQEILITFGEELYPIHEKLSIYH
jgi:hypothetical protein